jgi:hypothetical protein
MKTKLADRFKLFKMKIFCSLRVLISGNSTWKYYFGFIMWNILNSCSEPPFGSIESLESKYKWTSCTSIIVLPEEAGGVHSLAFE